MDNKRQKWVDRLLAGAKALPLLLILLVILFFGQNLDEITVEDILRYTPQNLLLAALVLVGAYAVKSVSGSSNASNARRRPNLKPSS